MCQFRAVYTAILLCLFTSSALAQVNVDQVIKIGRNALYFEDYVLAMQYFNQAITAKPYLDEPYFLRAAAKFELEDYKGAQTDVTMAIERNPFRTEAYKLRGVALQNQLQFSHAIQDYDQALKLMPTDREAKLNRAICYIMLKNYDLAEPDLKLLLHQDSTDERILITCVQLYLNKADTTTALHYIDRCLHVNKLNRSALLAKAQIFVDRDSILVARNTLNQVIDQQPDEPEYYINRAYLNYRLGDYVAAMQDYDQVIRLNPDRYESYYNRALLNAEVGEYDRAVADFTRVLKLSPKYVLALFNRSMVYMRTEHYRKAIADFDALLKIYPKFEAGYMARGQAKELMGDRTGANRDYDHAIAIMRSKGKHSSDYNPIEHESMKLQQKASQTSAGRDSVLTDSQISERFNQLLTIDIVGQDLQQATITARGKVQDQDAEPEPMRMFVLSYYAPVNALNGRTYYVRELSELNHSRILPEVLALTTERVKLTQQQVTERYRSITYYTGLMATATPRQVDYLARGIDMLMLHNTAAAMADTQRALANDSLSVLPLLLRNSILIMDFELTQSSTTTLSEQEKDLRVAQVNHATDLLMQSNEHLISHITNHEYALYNQGTLYLYQKEYQRAADYFSRALSMRPDLAEAYYNRGLANLHLGMTKQGLSDLSKAGELGILQSYSLLKRLTTEQK